MATRASTPETTVQNGLSMGHVALHYGPAEDGPLAARLLQLLGLTETQMLPLESGNFYRFVVNSNHFARGDGIVYLSALPEPQMRMIAAIRKALGVGTSHEDQSVTDFRAMMAQDYEASFHLGFLVPSLEELEKIVVNLRDLTETDTALKGRINIGMNRARLGNAEVDARLDASPVFGDCTRYAYGSNGVQIFVETDIIKAGQLGENMYFELDYVFPGYSSHVLSVVEL